MNDQPVQIDNPILIDRLEIKPTKDGKPQIALFSGALEYPVLTLAPFAYGHLFDVGFDPNEIQPGRAYYTRFFAEWEGATDEDGRPKINGKGNQYKNVVRLIPGRQDNDNLLREMQIIKQLITYLAEQQPGGREALIDWYKKREK